MQSKLHCVLSPKSAFTINNIWYERVPTVRQAQSYTDSMHFLKSSQIILTNKNGELEIISPISQKWESQELG